MDNVQPIFPAPKGQKEFDEFLDQVKAAPPMVMPPDISAAMDKHRLEGAALAEQMMKETMGGTVEQASFEKMARFSLRVLLSLLGPAKFAEFLNTELMEATKANAN